MALSQKSPIAVSGVLTLIVLPAVFLLWKQRGLKG